MFGCTVTAARTRFWLTVMLETAEALAGMDVALVEVKVYVAGVSVLVAL